MRILIPLGTRPEIVKLAPVARELTAQGFDVRIVATGQHHDAGLTDVFFEAFDVYPDERWTVEGDEGQRVGTILAMAYAEIGGRRPDLVLLVGDTHTVPLFCLAARRFQIPVAHLEAGLRSFNPTSMEEVNRRVAAATASLHLAPTDLAARFLTAEGVEEERIVVVGNPVIDSLRLLGVSRCAPADRSGVLVTAHRPTNVDDPRRLAALVDLITAMAEEMGSVTFPVHPRTRARLADAGTLDLLRRNPSVTLLEPVPYRHMLDLVASSRVVVTDSGGLQEEASWLGVPVVVLRRSTPRWEGVHADTSVLAGLDDTGALEAARRFCTSDEQARVAAAPCPYGDGHTAARVAALLAEPRTLDLLRIDEPDERTALVAP